MAKIRRAGRKRRDAMQYCNYQLFVPRRCPAHGDVGSAVCQYQSLGSADIGRIGHEKTVITFHFLLARIDCSEDMPAGSGLSAAGRVNQSLSGSRLCGILSVRPASITEENTDA